MWPVFSKTLYHSRKLILWLTIGFALYGVFIGALYPFIIENAESYDQIMESSPEMMAFLSGSSVEAFSIGNLGNYLQLEMMIWLMLIGGAVAIYQAFSAFTNAERDHSMDMLLSLPISRRENLMGQFAVTLLTAFVSMLGAYVGLVVTTITWEDVDFSYLEIAVGILGAILPVMVIGALSYLLAAMVPSSKRHAGAIAHVFWMGSYMVFGLTMAVESLNDLRPFFIYNYYNTGDLINNGINVSDWAVLLVVAAILLAAAWWRVDNKELGI